MIKSLSFFNDRDFVLVNINSKEFCSIFIKDFFFDFIAERPFYHSFNQRVAGFERGSCIFI